jgi:2-polyprenyl-3-methyl-5-hydroxy-6-metoxy-1,4-benzoquinol methylase
MTPAHGYLLPVVSRIVSEFFEGRAPTAKKVFDLGCGNGSISNQLTRMGCTVSGVDPSAEGTRRSKEVYNEIGLQLGSAYEDLPSRFGTFPLVVSLEVVEQDYDPRHYARTLFGLVEPGGGKQSYQHPTTDISRTWRWR